MDDIEFDDHIEEEIYDDTSHRACYIFRAGNEGETWPIESPIKKRKLNGHSAAVASTAKLSPYPNPDTLAERRHALFKVFWARQQSQIEQDAINPKSLQRLVQFSETAFKKGISDKLPTALLLTGLDDGNSKAIRHSLRKEFQHSKKIVIDLRSRQCMNLQSALKNIIKEVILVDSTLDTYNEFLAKHKRLIPQNFDLELLVQYLRTTNVAQINVVLSDVETFDSQVTNEFISILHVWRQRIPFTLMLGISSTRDLFEGRLSKSCLRLMDAYEFDFSPHLNLDSDIIQQTQGSVVNGPAIFLGPSAIFALHEIIRTQGSSARSLQQVLKFMYLSHFLANPLSLLSDANSANLTEDELSSLAQTVRKAESFKRYCEELLSRRNKASSLEVRNLLSDDAATLHKARESVSDGQEAYNKVLIAINGLADLHQNLAKFNPKLQRPKIEIESQLYQAINDLTDSAVFDEVETSIKSLPSAKLLHVLQNLHDATQSIMPNLLELVSVLEERQTKNENGSSVPMRPADGRASLASGKAKGRSKNTTTSTSISKTSQNEKNIDSVAEKLLLSLKENLLRCSLDVSSLILHEAYILSARSLRFKPNFEPHSRAATERALLRPGDYLGCDCCSTQNRNRVSSADLQQANSFPAASVLFTLLQEAPTIINVRDLFDAFQSRLGVTSGTPVSEADDNPAADIAMAQFYRVLAELKMIGLVKASTGTQIKKRGAGKNSKHTSQEVDFVAKTSWAGI